MITYIKINGFKSFQNFEMEFTPLTVIAGINASGKSNLFDALELLSRLADSDNLKKAFKDQRGDITELFTQYNQDRHSDTIDFIVEMLVDKEIADAWGNSASLKYTRLRYELTIKRRLNTSGIEDLFVTHEKLVNLKHEEDNWIKLVPKNAVEHWRPKVVTGKRGRPYIFTELQNNIPTVIVPQDGVKGNKRTYPLNYGTRTVLSTFDSVDFPHALAAKEEMRRWNFLQLNPEDLRKPTDKTSGDNKITASGNNLAAALFRIQQEDPYVLVQISRKLNSFLPNFIEVKVVDDVENKQYIIKLLDVDKKVYTSRVLSEGTLRLLALCILEYDEKHSGLLCFEEPENGIHPYRIQAMARLLKDLSNDFKNTYIPLRQIIVNTHSPVLIGNLVTWKKDSCVSVWFSEMRSIITDVDGKRLKLNISKIIPVLKDNSPQLNLEFTEQDKKYTLKNVEMYLSSNEFSDVL